MRRQVALPERRMRRKRGVMSKSPAQNPFIDPWGCQAYILRAEAVFLKELQTEQAATK